MEGAGANHGHGSSACCDGDGGDDGEDAVNRHVVSPKKCCFRGRGNGQVV